MKLYLIQRTDAIGYDEYDGAVVAAKDEDAAKALCPFSTVYSVTRRIGSTREKAGVILASFNAG